MYPAKKCTSMSDLCENTWRWTGIEKKLTKKWLDSENNQSNAGIYRKQFNRLLFFSYYFHSTKNSDHNDCSHVLTLSISTDIVLHRFRRFVNHKVRFWLTFSYPGLLLAEVTHISYHAPPKILYSFRHFTIWIKYQPSFTFFPHNSFYFRTKNYKTSGRGTSTYFKRLLLVKHYYF